MKVASYKLGAVCSDQKLRFQLCIWNYTRY